MDLNISDPEQIKQLINLLQGLLPKETTPTSDDNEEHLSPAIKTKTSKSSKRTSKNKFLSMPEMKMHKDDCVIDQKLSKGPPTPRTRKFEPIDVACRSCGKKEKVSPDVIPDSVERYRCNKCASAGT